MSGRSFRMFSEEIAQLLSFLGGFLEVIIDKHMTAFQELDRMHAERKGRRPSHLVVPVIFGKKSKHYPTGIVYWSFLNLERNRLKSPLAIR